MTEERAIRDAIFAWCMVVIMLLACAVLGISLCNERERAKELRERVSELEARPMTIELVREEPEGAAWQSVGECTITHYCGCADCCGKSDCITATGAPATMGRTVSVDPDVIPLGSEVLINGVCYIAEDTGVNGKAVDIYIESHEQARDMGTYSAMVYRR